MAEILRAQIEPYYYRLNTLRNTVAGGFSTSFIELPYNYILGGFEYSKDLLASVKNGHVGMYSDTKSLALSDYTSNQESSTYENRMDAGMVHSGLLGYFGGFWQPDQTLHYHINQNYFRPRTLACGTIGRRPRPTSCIRDTGDTSIIYVVMTGPNRNQLFGVAKIDTKNKKMLWRQSSIETLAVPANNYNDDALIGDLFGYVHLPVDYLYQDDSSLYFLYCGPKTRAAGTFPSAVYIYRVDKNTGSLSEVSYFNLYTLGMLSSEPGWLTYKFLGFRDQNSFLVELQQITVSEAANTGANTSRPDLRSGALIYKALVAYDVNDLVGTILWASDPLIPPISRNVNHNNRYVMAYPLTGSLILPELENSVFIPLEVQSCQWNSYTEAITQVYLDKDHTKVLDSKILPVIGPYGRYQSIVSTPDTPQLNAAYNIDHYTSPVFNHSRNIGEVSAGDTYSPYNIAYTDRFVNMLQGKGMTNIIHHSVNAIYGNFPWSKYWYSSYDHMVTERKEPMLRIHGISPEGRPVKTILPCGEDLIGQGHTLGRYSYSNQLAPTEYVYQGDSLVAHPWGIIVSKSGFDPSNSNAQVVNGSTCYGLTTRPQGYPMVYMDGYDGTNPYHPDKSTSLAYWIGTLPGCSYTLRRSDPDLQNCAIYLNEEIFPIHAVSYSLDPNPARPDAAPTSWYVEAHDVETDTWIEVDRKENVSLAFNPISMDGDFYKFSPYHLATQGTPYPHHSDTRQYHNYFVLEDMETKCPKGAHAFRITFTDSADGATVVVGSWMIQEKPWAWKQAQAPDFTYWSYSNKAYAYSISGPVQWNNSYANSAIGTSANPAQIPYSLAALSILGPRTLAHIPPCYGDDAALNNRNYFIIGVAPYSTNTSGLVDGMAVNLQFADEIEICGVQFSMFGLRQNITSISGFANYGASIPSGVKIERSMDNANWELITTIPLEKLPGLSSSYTNIAIWSKTYLYEFDTPTTCRYLRASCIGPQVGMTSTYGKRIWALHNFSAMQKRDPSFAGKAVSMQSIIGKHYFRNNRPTGYYQNTALFEGTNTATDNNFWDPWLTIHPSLYGSVPNGFNWGGFDRHGTLHIGYQVEAGSSNNVNALSPYDVICNAGYITASQPVVLMASWKGMNERKFKLGLESSDHTLHDHYIGMPLVDEQVFDKALYATRIKILAYSFIRPNYRDVNVGVPYRWNVYGSVDGQSWDLIDSRTKDTWNPAETVIEFPVNDPDWYVYYKWEFLESSDGGLNLMSIDTFISEIDDTCPYIHTRYPKNGLIAVDSDAEVENGSIVRGGAITHQHVYWNGSTHPIHIKYEGDELSIIIDQKKPIYTNSLLIALNLSMDESELPKHIKVTGSNDKATWNDMHDQNPIVWEQEDLYRNRLMLDTPGTYRYIKATFYKPQIAPEGITEYWLLNTMIFNDNNYQPCNQGLFKIKSGEALIYTSSEMATPLANLWISDNSLARVQQKNIDIKRLDPITQSLATVRSIVAPNGNDILGTVLDSGKNLWYWINTASSNAWNADPAVVAGKPDGYCALCVQSSYSVEAVKVKFDESVAKYEGSPLLLKLHTWIEDTTVTAGENKVAGEVKLTLSGGGAKFVSTGEDTVTVTVNAGEMAEVEFTASGPDRVSATATLIK